MPWQPMQVLALSLPASVLPAASASGAASSANIAAAQRTVFIIRGAPELDFCPADGSAAGAICSGKTPAQSMNKAKMPEVPRGGSGMQIPVTAALAGFSGLLLVTLASRVSMLRMRHKVAFGDGGNPELMRAIRTHGNTAEYAPLFVLLVLAWEL